MYTALMTEYLTQSKGLASFTSERYLPLHQQNFLVVSVFYNLL